MIDQEIDLTVELNKTRKRCRELEQFLADAMAYMRFCARNDESDKGQLLTLAHDIGGLHRKEWCFRPRVSGYAEQGH